MQTVQQMELKDQDDVKISSKHHQNKILIHESKESEKKYYIQLDSNKIDTFLRTGRCLIVEESLVDDNSANDSKILWFSGAALQENFGKGVLSRILQFISHEHHSQLASKKPKQMKKSCRFKVWEPNTKNDSRMRKTKKEECHFEVEYEHNRIERFEVTGTVIIKWSFKTNDDTF